MDTQTWDALTESMKNAYVTGLKEGAVPRPVIMPLVRGQLVGLIWLRPVENGPDALTGIASLSNIAAAAGADEVVLAWETHDVAGVCELPATGPAPCLNMVHATKDGHTLHQFPYTENVLDQGTDGRPSTEPHWQPAPAPAPGGALVPPVHAAVDYAFTPLDLDHPSPFGVTVVLMEEDGYTLHLTEAFAV
ncbi:hypothetical protein [Streptomyces sp. SID13726]|uniref:hypothetical protein n=1 Tax=Streptomyces sp. SID13726 TaxID=2706058 RepID=UPI0013BBD7E2|nr:hypothetical protein [Streptomyces sp. SID13726]NEA99595.1 hypothetical protein [Streptomyces sp. SID13726]